MKCLQDVRDCSISANWQIGEKKNGNSTRVPVCISNVVHTATQGGDTTEIIWNADTNYSKLRKENRPGGFDSKTRESRRIIQRKLDRRRTDALNIAYAELRALLPLVPQDTKLTKLRTLLGAIAYIKQLMALIYNGDAASYQTPQNLYSSYSWMPKLEMYAVTTCPDSRMVSTHPAIMLITLRASKDDFGRSEKMSYIHTSSVTHSLLSWSLVFSNKLCLLLYCLLSIVLCGEDRKKWDG
ncbi:hypothetical protein ACTXT7_011542 [Hymenolepis weldensis]